MQVFMALQVRSASFSSIVLPALNEKAILSVTDQQKKVLMVALAAISFLTLFFAIKYAWFNNSPQVQKAPAEVRIQKMTFLNGDVAEGVMTDGKLNGPGKITCLEGEILEGIFQEGRLIRGRRTYTKGGSEDGTFNAENQLHGKGTKILQDGTVEDGDFQNGRLNGMGKVSAQDFSFTEEGTFRNGRLVQGQRILGDGTRYEGEFKGKLIKGTVFSADGAVIETIGL